MAFARTRNWLRNFWYHDTIDEMQRKMLRSARIRHALIYMQNRAKRTPRSKRVYWVTTSEQWARG